VNCPAVGMNYYSETIKIALEHAKLRVSDIDFLCPHGIGGKVYDAYEAKSITEVFGKRSKKLSISAFKPYIGHNLGASALIETIILLLSLRNNTIPATLNTEFLDERLQINLVKKTTKKKIKFALKVCSAFAGYDAATLFKSIS